MGYTGLNKCNGAECPSCGCNDTVKRTFRGRWGEVVSRWACQHCGRTFVAADPTEPTPQPPPSNHHTMPEVPPGMVIYPLIEIKCPVDQGGCGSTDTKVSRTKRPVRYHKCGACGKSFKSVEQK